MLAQTEDEFLPHEHCEPILRAAVGPPATCDANGVAAVDGNIIASIAHAGELIPAAIASRLRVPTERLYADWYTDRLFDFLPTLCIATLLAPVHRVVCDVNRDPSVPLGPWPRAAVTTTSTRDEPLYAVDPTLAQAQARIARVHAPFHAALARLPRHDGAAHRVLLDCHSFGMPLGVDVVLGDGHGTTAPTATVERLADALRAQGFSVARNQPFAGGWIVRSHASATVHATQIEINQRLYLDPRACNTDDWVRPAYDPARAMATGQRLRAAVLAFAHVQAEASG